MIIPNDLSKGPGYDLGQRPVMWTSIGFIMGFDIKKKYGSKRSTGSGTTDKHIK